MQTENQAVSFLRSKGFVINDDIKLGGLGTSLYNKSTDTSVYVRFESNKFKTLGYTLKSDKNYATLLLKEIIDSNFFKDEEGNDWIGYHLFYTNDVIGIDVLSSSLGGKISYCFNVYPMLDFVDQVSSIRNYKRE